MDEDDIEQMLMEAYEDGYADGEGDGWLLGWNDALDGAGIV